MTQIERERWHVGIGPAITIAIFFATYAGTTIWWMSGIDRDTQDNTIRIGAAEEQLDAIAEKASNAAVAAGRVEERLGAITATLGRIERAVDADRP